MVFLKTFLHKIVYTANVRADTEYVPCFLTILIIAAPKVRQTILPPLRGFD